MTKPNTKENKDCHDELLAQFSENYDNVEKLALSEINNVEFVMPICSNVGSLGKYQFNLLLKRIKKIGGSSQHLATMVAICMDSFTCMINNSSFYESYAFENKVNISLIKQLLNKMYMVVSSCHDIPTKAVWSLIVILEKSAERIQFSEIEFFNEITMYIKRLQIINTCNENQRKEQLIDKITHQNSVGKQHNVMEEPFEMTGSKLMHTNESVPSDFIKRDTFQFDQQLQCTEILPDDTNFANKKENVQPPKKKLKLDTTNNSVIPYNVQVAPTKKNAFNILMSRSLLKKK